MKEPRTEIELKGIKIPFYKTNRGQFDFFQAGFTMDMIATGREDAMLANIYYWARACARREAIEFPFKSFDEFIDSVDGSVYEVYTRLKAERDREADEPGE